MKISSMIFDILKLLFSQKQKKKNLVKDYKNIY